VAPERIEWFLQQLPVDALWGVVPVTAKRLRERGIHRSGDIRTADPRFLRTAVGSSTEWLKRLAVGEDDRPVEPDRPSKSSSSSAPTPRT
jgi:DNA polymerase-4